MMPGGMTKPPSNEEIENIKNQMIEKQMQQIQQTIPQGLKGVPGGIPNNISIPSAPPGGIPEGGQMPQATQMPQNIPEPFQNIPNTAPNP